MRRPFYKYDGVALTFKYGTNEHRFYDYLIKKENYQRYSKELKQGQLRLTVRNVEKDMGISKGSAQRLIDLFIELGILINIFKPKKGSTKPSIYCMSTYIDNNKNIAGTSDINAGTDVGTETDTDIGTDKLSNINDYSIKVGTDVGTDNDTEFGTSKKELIKRINKKEIYSRVITRLNEVTNKKYKPTTKKTIDCINARLNEDFTEHDFYEVIEIKCEEWLGTKNEKYLRPETLFGNKFEGYLNQPKDQQNKEQKEIKINRNIKANSVEDAIKLIRGGTDGR